MLPYHISHKITGRKDFITDQLQVGILGIINADKNGPVLGQQFLQQLQPGIHHAKPFVVAGQVLPLFAHDLPQPLLDSGVIHIVVIYPALVSGVIGRIYVPADFDTKEKALSMAKAAEKGLK